MDQVIAQAPVNISNEKIEEIFIKNNNDVIKTLTELWNIEEEPIKNKNKWDEIRETCDDFDKEMGKFMDCMKSGKNYKEQ
jgi:hypothetical protein